MTRSATLELGGRAPARTPGTGAESATADLASRWSPLAALLLLIGAGLRLFQYFADRPLWYDEAMLANNLLARSLLGLAQPLEGSQIAPYGFLVVEKAAVGLFGGSEYTLRLVPLVMGLGALLLFWIAATRCLSRPAALLALALFAVSPRLIYYSAEVKQYSTDLAVGLLFLVLALEARRAEQMSGWLRPLAATAILGVWLSQAAALVLAGALVALAVSSWKDHDRRSVVALAGISVAAALSTSASVAVTRSAQAGSDLLASFWAAGFLPLPPVSLADLATWGAAFVRPFRDPLMFTVPLAAVGAYAVGVGSLARRKRGFELLLLVLPVALALLAAGLRLYPYGDEILYGGRVQLFLAPVLLLTVCAGVDVFRRRLGIRPVAFGLVILALLLAPRLLSGPIRQLHDRFPALKGEVVAQPLPPFVTEAQDPRPVLRRMAEHTRPDDVIYVYFIAGPPFRYYAPRLGVAGQWVRGMASGDDPAEVAHEVNLLRGHPRVWLFFAYAHGDRAVPFIRHAGQFGDLLMVLEEGGVGALLYDFSDA